MNTWPRTPDEALRFLLEGNQRFLAGRPDHPHADAARRAASLEQQRPFAALLGCSDSRVAAEIVFDRGVGDLFVVRTAGHLVGAEVLASLEYAVSVLEVPLVAVLGHDRCGAVAAAVHAHDHGSTLPGHLHHIVERLSPEVVAAEARGITQPDAIAEAHAQATAHLLLQQCAPLRERVEAGTCGIAVLTYRLAEGRAHLLGRHGFTGAPDA